MAARSRADEPARPKPKNDAYVGLLAISLLALLGATALLYFDLRRYPTSEPPKVPPSDARAPADIPNPVPNPNPPKPNPNPMNPMPMPMPMPMN
jgi:hypothetical protein